MDEFLKVEYEQCMSLLKYYDEKQLSLMKFSAGLSSAVVSAAFAVYKLGPAFIVGQWDLLAFVSAVTALGLLVLYIAMVQNRLYFIYPVRQVNAIRKTMLVELGEKFAINQMYLDTAFSAFKWCSAHTLMNALVSLQIGLFTGGVIYALNATSKHRVCMEAISVGISLITSAVIVLISANYLKTRSDGHPDDGIHQLKKRQAA